MSRKLSGNENLTLSYPYGFFHAETFGAGPAGALASTATCWAPFTPDTTIFAQQWSSYCIVVGVLHDIDLA